MAEKTITRQVTIAGRSYDLRSGDVAHTLREVEPEPIASHYVVVGHRRFPPKQVISEVTGLDRADFTSHQARRTLMRLGFAAGRRRAGKRADGPTVHSALGTADAHLDPERLVDRLRPHAGQWVAVKDDELIHAAHSPQELVGWLARHGQRADSMFRVPEDQLAASGLAPL